MSNGIYTSGADGRGRGGTGKHAGFRGRCSRELGGSNPSARIARLIEARAAGYYAVMATPEDRERESRESDTTKFEEQADEVREEQREAMERIAQPLEPQDEDSD